MAVGLPVGLPEGPPVVLPVRYRPTLNRPMALRPRRHLGFPPRLGPLVPPGQAAQADRPEAAVLPVVSRMVNSRCRLQSARDATPRKNSDTSGIGLSEWSVGVRIIDKTHFAYPQVLRWGEYAIA